MTASHDTLARDIGHLEGRVEEIHVLVTTGFKEVKDLIKDLESKLEDRVEKLDERVRVTETNHASKSGQHRAFGWIINSVQMIVAAFIGAFGGHWLK